MANAQRERERAHARTLLTSTSPLEVERARLLLRKADVDDAIEVAKSELDEREPLEGQSRRVQQLKVLLRQRRNESQELQARMGLVTQQLKQQNIAASNAEARRFVKAARKLLDAETFQRILDAARSSG
jgi:hypothetical protein